MIADVSDNLGHAKSFAESTEAEAYVQQEMFQLLSSGGEGAFCTTRKELKRVVERLKATNATRKLGGECECVGDVNHQGCYKSVPSSMQSY